MKRVVIGALIGAVLLGGFADPAQAQRRKRGKKRAAPPVSAQISEDLGELKWGMSRKQVLDHFKKKVIEEYRPKIAKATGAIEEDKLRHQQREKIARMKDSLTNFTGTTTGWDVSFLKGEFTHNNGESLFMVRDENSQNFYFFINGKLWKWFKAFNADVFEGRSFKQFASAIQGRYGKAQSRNGVLAESGKKTKWLEWQDQGSRLRAIDNTQFYGFYCLVFDSKDTLSRLADLRTNKPRKRKEGHSMVDAVTAALEDDSEDGNADVVDRITGRIRNRQQAPKGKGKKSASRSSSSSGSSSGSDEGWENNTDPLRGL